MNLWLRIANERLYISLSSQLISSKNSDMIKRALALMLIPLPLSAWITYSSAQTSHADKAIAFINSLTTEQQKNVLFPFYYMSPHEWSYLPASTS